MWWVEADSVEGVHVCSCVRDPEGKNRGVGIGVGVGVGVGGVGGGGGGGGGSDGSAGSGCDVKSFMNPSLCTKKKLNSRTYPGCATDILLIHVSTCRHQESDGFDMSAWKWIGVYHEVMDGGWWVVGR